MTQAITQNKPEPMQDQIGIKSERSIRYQEQESIKTQADRENFQDIENKSHLFQSSRYSRLESAELTGLWIQPLHHGREVAFLKLAQIHSLKGQSHKKVGDLRIFL
jgi:hypothetical protein